MNQEQIKTLRRIKKLVYANKCHFEIRKDRDYVRDLANLGLTEDDAWKHILQLNCNLYYRDSRQVIGVNNKALTFKKKINNKIAYIKVLIEIINDEEVVCLSFHEDGR